MYTYLHTVYFFKHFKIFKFIQKINEIQLAQVEYYKKNFDLNPNLEVELLLLSCINVKALFTITFIRKLVTCKIEPEQEMHK